MPTKYWDVSDHAIFLHYAGATTLPAVAPAGRVVRTLPEALAFPVAPAGAEGAAAGIQDFSRGVGVVLGPILVGGAIDLFRDQLSSTAGYAAMWPVVGVPVLLAVAVVGTVRVPPGPEAETPDRPR